MGVRQVTNQELPALCGQKSSPAPSLICLLLVIPSQWLLVRSEQEMDQSQLGPTHSGGLSFWPPGPSPLSLKDHKSCLLRWVMEVEI
jgi:hypothetical protein